MTLEAVESTTASQPLLLIISEAGILDCEVCSLLSVHCLTVK